MKVRKTIIAGSVAAALAGTCYAGEGGAAEANVNDLTGPALDLFILPSIDSNRYDVITGIPWDNANLRVTVNQNNTKLCSDGDSLLCVKDIDKGSSQLGMVMLELPGFNGDNSDCWNIAYESNIALDELKVRQMSSGEFMLVAKHFRPAGQPVSYITAEMQFGPGNDVCFGLPEHSVVFNVSHSGGLALVNWRIKEKGAYIQPARGGSISAKYGTTTDWGDYVLEAGPREDYIEHRYVNLTYRMSWNCWAGPVRDSENIAEDGYDYDAANLHLEFLGEGETEIELDCS